MSNRQIWLSGQNRRGKGRSPHPVQTRKMGLQAWLGLQSASVTQLPSAL